MRLGTRGSLLARAQSQHVADALRQRHPHVQVELCIIRTAGDRVSDRPLHNEGGKGLFVRELEQALLDGEIDFAVHSLKDMPALADDRAGGALVVAAVPPRADARDALVSAGCRRLADLPAGARVATGSLRRRCQLLSARPDLHVEPLRGNIDTRLRRLREGRFDAVILALAGLLRAGLFDERIMTPIDSAEMLPAAGQGALCVQCRADRADVRSLLAELNDPDTALCTNLERRVVRMLGGDCTSPLAVLATLCGDVLWLRVAVGHRGGLPPVLRAEARGSPRDAEALAQRVAGELSDRGALAMLRPDAAGEP